MKTYCRVTSSMEKIWRMTLLKYISYTTVLFKEVDPLSLISLLWMQNFKFFIFSAQNHDRIATNTIGIKRSNFEGNIGSK